MCGQKSYLDVQGRGAKPIRRKRRRRAPQKAQAVLVSMFWNARGLADQVDEAIDYMQAKSITVAAFCESKTFGEELSRRGYSWHAGPETLPKRGAKLPRMGVGFLVHDATHPHAEIVEKKSYSAWLRLKGDSQDLYICGAYAPVYKAQKMDALKEILDGCVRYRNKGHVIVGGDLNVRCAANGDKTTSKPGRYLMTQSAAHGLEIVNQMNDLCQGEFSRVQEVKLKHGGHTTRQTTVDYVLVAAIHEGSVAQFQIDADSLTAGLGSQTIGFEVSVGGQANNWPIACDRSTQVPSQVETGGDGPR